MDTPLLDLPAYETQEGGKITVQNAFQALDVLNYIPRELDNMVGVVINGPSDNIKMSKLIRAFGL